MKKRVWSLFLALALCLAMIPQTALAEAGGGNVSAAGGGEDNVHAVAAQTTDDGNTRGETAGGENSTESENCTHAQVTQNTDNNYYCEKCKKQMFVEVKSADGTTTYGTDLVTAMNTATSGTTITLLADIDNNGKYLRLTGNKTVTLDFHGHTINGGYIRIGIDQDGSTHTSSTLKIVGSGSFKMGGEISVGYNATLDLSEWGGGENDTIDYVSLRASEATENLESTLLVGEKMKGTIKSLYFDKWPSSDTRPKLNGGTYDGIFLPPVPNDSKPFGSLLASGYAFRYTDGGHKGEFVEYTETNSYNMIYYVKVVKCPHAKIEKKTCAYCGTTDIVATIGSTAYTEIGAAVTAWLDKGGTLTLHDNAGKNAITSFSSASGKNLVIDLNGYPINLDTDGSGEAVKLNGVNLTIRDSKRKASPMGAFGPINADSGTLTVEEDGYLQGLTVPENSTATIHLRDGKVYALNCEKPVYTLLEDGYALMNGNNTVDPTKTLASTTQTYTVTNAQITNKSGATSGSTSIGSGTLPFDLSLKTNDKEIRRVQFYWYRINENGKPLLLAESKDVWPDKNGVYRYDTTTNGNGKDGWTGLEANKTHQVICVVAGKENDGAYRWQTVLKGYKLTITPADLASEKTVITQVADNSLGVPFMGNIGSADGTFVFEPYSGDLRNATTLTYCFKVAYNGKTLKRDVDYEIVSGDKAKDAGTHTLTIEG